MSNIEDVKLFVLENSIVITFIVIVIAIIYINLKINDIDYRLQQTIMYYYGGQNNRQNVGQYGRQYDRTSNLYNQT